MRIAKIRFFVSALFFLLIINSSIAQINNYWTMGSNTSSTLLGGAVVGGGAGDVAIFYNPAAIRLEDQKQIALNASLLSFDFHKYENALGYSRDLDYLEWGVKPRFLSYQFNLQNNHKFSYQIAFFSRDDQLTELYDYKSVDVRDINGNQALLYTANYDLQRKYQDYWVGVGASYILSPKFSIGMTIFGSGKSLRYYYSSVIDTEPLTNNGTKNSNWSNVEKSYLYVVSIIPKIGFLYEEDLISFGLNISLPSMRLWGDGYNKRSIKYSNIIYNGQDQDDYIHSGYNNYMVANIKEPFSISFGMTLHSSNDKSKLFFTTEYFAPIETYRMLDNTKIAAWGQDEFQAGTDFLSYKYGAKQIVNFALGFRHQLRPALSILSGIKTNFSAYSPSEYGEWENINEYVTVTPSLYHASLGAQFRFMANTIILGTEYSFGMSKNMPQLANYGYPGIFDEDHHIALQNLPEDVMKYTSNSLAFYIGYTLDF